MPSRFKILKSPSRLTGSQTIVYIIDLDGATASAGSQQRWFWNLSRFAFDAVSKQELSLTLHYRFLRAYLEANFRCELDWKAAWRELAKQIRKREERR
ncbi:MAG: hypothetical protein R3C11_04010 [Planctomycetaceae bacterium]